MSKKHKELIEIVEGLEPHHVKMLKISDILKQDEKAQRYQIIIPSIGTLALVEDRVRVAPMYCGLAPKLFTEDDILRLLDERFLMFAIPFGGTDY